MTNEEAIEMFKSIIMAEIDRLPHHYDEEVGEDVYDDTSKVNELLQLNKIVSKALEKQMQNCGNCRHAKHSSYNNIIYCLNLSRVMLSNNCCRNWIGKR
jgi:hypothetical protein